MDAEACTDPHVEHDPRPNHVQRCGEEGGRPTRDHAANCGLVGRQRQLALGTGRPTSLEELVKGELNRRERDLPA
jgi:hypothetical protein